MSKYYFMPEGSGFQSMPVVLLIGHLLAVLTLWYFLYWRLQILRLVNASVRYAVPPAVGQGPPALRVVQISAYNSQLTSSTSHPGQIALLSFCHFLSWWCFFLVPWTLDGTAPAASIGWVVAMCLYTALALRRLVWACKPLPPARAWKFGVLLLGLVCTAVALVSQRAWIVWLILLLGLLAVGLGEQRTAPPPEAVSIGVPPRYLLQTIVVAGLASALGLAASRLQAASCCSRLSDVLASLAAVGFVLIWWPLYLQTDLYETVAQSQASLARLRGQSITALPL